MSYRPSKRANFAFGFSLGFVIVLLRTCHRYPYDPGIALAIPTAVGLVFGYAMSRYGK